MPHAFIKGSRSTSPEDLRRARAGIPPGLAVDKAFVQASWLSSSAFVERLPELDFKDNERARLFMDVFWDRWVTDDQDMLPLTNANYEFRSRINGTQASLIHSSATTAFRPSSLPSPGLTHLLLGPNPTYTLTQYVGDNLAIRFDGAAVAEELRTSLSIDLGPDSASLLILMSRYIASFECVRSTFTHDSLPEMELRLDTMSLPGLVEGDPTQLRFYNLATLIAPFIDDKLDEVIGHITAIDKVVRSCESYYPEDICTTKKLEWLALFGRADCLAVINIPWTPTVFSAPAIAWHGNFLRGDLSAWPQATFTSSSSVVPFDT